MWRTGKPPGLLEAATRCLPTGSGLMKAVWNLDDVRDMTRSKFDFSDTDVEMLRRFQFRGATSHYLLEAEKPERECDEEVNSSRSHGGGVERSGGAVTGGHGRPGD